MTTLQALFLGIIQGVTEFLPVSSSGHLVLLQHLFGLEEQALFFDISLHVGTLAAVVFFFRKEVGSIIAALWRGLALLIKGKTSMAQLYSDMDVKMAVLIVAGCVPTAIIGLMFKQWSEQIFSSLFLVGIMLILTGGFLWSTRWIKKTGGGIEGFAIKNAVMIGIIQGLAILPGISRSGSTITAALFLGINRETAARYSFLLSIPAIVGAEILSLMDLSLETAISLKATLIGTVTACVVGYASLKMLVYIVSKGRLYIFSPYCWLVGVIILIAGC
ncbi:MAG: undecaprenyl-diphosphate phosphatase [Deltaproteobacteria bacterium]|nr:undecaprenyl-diphosphate phosphatase [Deltaproteobacteria bacterium]